MSGSIRLTGVNGLPLGGSGLRYPGVYAALDFAGNHYELASRSYGNLANVPGFSFTRASTAWGFGSNGLLQSFASGVARFVYDPVTLASLGILVEEARTNICLWNRDLTNAAWVAINVTPVKDQTGIDGVANSASKITATGAAGTILQTIVLASSTRQQSAYVKRITGTGVVNMTTDGVTWTAITLTAAWTRVTIPAQAAVVNPVLGFQIMTSGDALAVDFVQNEAGTGASSVIATTTTAVTRLVDAVTVTGLAVSAIYTAIVEGRMGPAVGIANVMAGFSKGSGNDGAALYFSNGSPVALNKTASSLDAVIIPAGSATANAAVRLAGRFETNNINGSFNGGAIGTTDTSCSVVTATQLEVGNALVNSGNQFKGTISRIRIYNRALSDAQLQSLTT